MKQRCSLSYVMCIALAAICIFILDGCKKKEIVVEEKTYNVIVKSAEKRQLRPFIESMGTLHPFEEVTIGAEIDGIIKTVKVNEGSVVSKGMLLATIDDIEYSHEVIRAEALVRQTEATLANTKLEFSRKETLYKEQLVTSQQYDDVSTRLAHAEAELERAKAALIIAKQKQAKTRVYAPLASKVKEKKVSAGDFVKNGTPLFVIIQPNPLKLRFAVPEKDIGKVGVGQDITLKVDAFPDTEFKGKVSIVFPSIEEKTRTLMVEAIVPNPNNLLKPGLFAKSILYTGLAKDTVVVPVTSLLYEADKVKLFTVENDRARERFVKLGGKYGELMEILDNGIKEGEQVVVVGQQNLAEGAKVSVQKEVGQETRKKDQTPGSADKR